MKQLIHYTPLLAPLAPVLLLVGALWGGSRTPAPEMLEALQPSFRTTDSSVLFFKNIRSVHYDKRAGPADGIDLYTLRGLDDAPLKPFIVHNWLADGAYVMYETGVGPDVLIVEGTPVDLNREMPEDAFRTTMRLCAAFERNDQITTTDGVGLSENRRHAKLFLRLCRDYLELVDLF
ncbi:MAG: hypothetical protein AAF658_10525 [Myxococcota bacterium]